MLLDTIEFLDVSNHNSPEGFEGLSFCQMTPPSSGRLITICWSGCHMVRTASPAPSPRVLWGWEPSHCTLPPSSVWKGEGGGPGHRPPPSFRSRETLLPPSGPQGVTASRISRIQQTARLKLARSKRLRVLAEENGMDTGSNPAPPTPSSLTPTVFTWGLLVFGAVPKNPPRLAVQQVIFWQPRVCPDRESNQDLLAHIGLVASPPRGLLS